MSVTGEGETPSFWLIQYDIYLTIIFQLLRFKIHFDIIIVHEWKNRLINKSDRLTCWPLVEDTLVRNSHLTCSLPFDIGKRDCFTHEIETSEHYTIIVHSFIYSFTNIFIIISVIKIWLIALKLSKYKLKRLD